MSDRKDDEQSQEAFALFRYRLIADAIDAERGARGTILQEVALREHLAPDGRTLRVSLRTLERWLVRFEKHRLEGLRRAARRDRGTTRGITDAALSCAVQLRKESPVRSTATLIDILERSASVAPGALKRSTLDRHLDRQGASRRMLYVLGAKRHVRLSFEHALDFVVGDFHAGPYVRVQPDQIVRARLCAFIDHCTRYVPESRYGVGSEDFMAVRRGLRTLCTAWGLPRRLYVDNGPGYQAHRFHFGCHQLGIEYVHSTAHVSEGRGLIERFNRTVKDAFETEVRLRPEPPTLEELNAFWRAFLDERYHRRVHSEIEEEPLLRWQRLLPQADVRVADPVLLDEVLRLRARRSVHKKTSTVEVLGVRFVVDTALRGRRVEVLFDPYELGSVLIFYDGRRIQRATPQVPGEHPVGRAQPQPAPPPSVDYLALLRRDHEQRRASEISQVRFRAVNDDDALLTLALLVERLRACTGRVLGDVETQHAHAVLDSLSPVEIAIADVALKAAVAQLGRGLHASQYLESLRAHVLRARRKGTP